MKKLFTTSVILGCMIFYTTAQVINIPDDKTTIQAGIDSASTGDTVLVQEGTWYENINFKGKAITVASQFILDGDTSHISKTIIDGSQCTNPDTASTVLMVSGEDTTSVLMGFTITGGKGTVVEKALKDHQGLNFISGGGVLILNSGGKITHNIVEEINLAGYAGNTENIWW
jgi:hypothetical protein